MPWTGREKRPRMRLFLYLMTMVDQHSLCNELIFTEAVPVDSEFPLNAAAIGSGLARHQAGVAVHLTFCGHTEG